MTKLDDFTLNLLCNDEVLALDQDALGKEATCVLTNGNLRVYEKELEDGGRALGFFNLGSTPVNLQFSRLTTLGFTGKQHVRNLWRQSDLPDVDATGGILPLTIPGARRDALQTDGGEVNRPASRIDSIKRRSTPRR